MIKLSDKDTLRLKRLAEKQYTLSQKAEMKLLCEEWTAHNDCAGGRPMITVELGTFAQDILPQLLRCEGETARAIEARLLGSTVNHELFRDDSIVPDHFALHLPARFVPFNIPVQVDRLEGSLGHHFVEVLHDLEADFHKLQPCAFSVDTETLLAEEADYRALFDDVLPVSVKGSGLYAVPTQDIVHIMSMENMMLAMYDCPDEFHAMMRLLTDGYLAYFRFLEREGLLLPTAAGEPLGQGTYCFTSELPNAVPANGRLALKNVWGFLDSQETAGISPEMYAEFVFPYYRKIAESYGLLSYGCCEAVHPIWESCLSKLKNLRKLSISPWCDEAYMGERLRGRRTVFHRKPSPNFLGVGEVLEEDALRAHIRKTVQAAKGCTLEFTQRDVYEIHGTYHKVARYVEILREECQSF